MSAVSDLADPQEATEAYYAPENHSRWSTRTQSVSDKQLRGRPAFAMTDDGGIVEKPRRRLSHDERSSKPRKFLIDVESTLRLVLEQEDTDGNFQICITDAGPKVFALGTATSNGFNSFDIRGNWMLSVLLQELALAKDHGRKTIILDESRLSENPVSRLSRMIRTSFWDGLTRRIDADGLELICTDPKNRSANQSPRIYVPEAEPEMIEYYRKVAAEKPHIKLEVVPLPHDFDARYVKDLNHNPGILALAMKKAKAEDGNTTLQGIPFVVPGARFNELYDWDSYFISLGLLADGRLELAKGIVDHFIFQIKHYGKVCNGSRSYYLMRSQPPFLTDLALQIYERLDPSTERENRAWLKAAIKAAIKEYHLVWMSEPRLDPVTGLSRYRPDGLGVPPETEASHFTHILKPYAEKHGISVNEFVERYNDGEVHEPELDVYFVHDRAVRESGHDTTYRFEKKCADLATIDLNSLLFKYEHDIASAIRLVFDDEIELDEEFTLTSFPYGTEVPMDEGAFGFEKLNLNGEHKTSKDVKQTSAEWIARATRRKQLMDHYLWDAGQGIYFDYDTHKKKRILYESCTSLWALFAGAASKEQAAKLVARSLPKFEVAGGVVSGSEASLGKVSLDHPNRQWDWPQMWAPHQMLAWMGLARYEYHGEAQRLAYRWCHTLTKAFVDYNGVIPEKFDGVKRTHFVTAEYGNQGIDFHHVPREGFGWTNASYNLGLTYLDDAHKRLLHVLVDPVELFDANKGR